MITKQQKAKSCILKAATFQTNVAKKTGLPILVSIHDEVF
jgi:hypothetical protein